MAELPTRVQWLLVAVSEVTLYLSYRGHEASFHWSTHFLVGATVALALATIRLSRGRSAHRALPLRILGWHLVAMFPDLLFQAGIAHHRWMDVFLGHISSHFVPGRNVTWLATAALALVIYRRRLDEHDRPGVAYR